MPRCWTCTLELSTECYRCKFCSARFCGVDCGVNPMIEKLLGPACPACIELYWAPRPFDAADAAFVSGLFLGAAGGAAGSIE
jgi:hypothetical protein